MGKTYRKEKDQHSKHTARRSMEVDRQHRRDEADTKHLLNDVMHHELSDFEDDDYEDR